MKKSKITLEDIKNSNMSMEDKIKTLRNLRQSETNKAVVDGMMVGLVLGLIFLVVFCIRN